ncbi:hypothetical protein AWENTII_007284 [Aspergillus wentii]
MAIESAQLRDHLCHSWGALCFEMEAAGLMDYFPCLVIRGICDYSDTHKTKVWQPYAAVTAAAYAKDLLRVIGPRQVAKTEVATSILQDDHVDGDVRQIRKTVDDAYKARVMDWICPMDYSSQQSDFFAQHEEGTGNWLLTSESFQKWLHGSNQILLGEVIPGTGKTILTSIVINYLQTYFDQNNDVGIAYIFCNFRQQHEQTLNGLLAASERAYFTYTGGDFKYVSAVVMSYQKVLIVVDAVDEIRTSDGTCRDFLSTIFYLQQSTEVSVFATSRSNTGVSTIFKNNHSSFLEIRALNDDLRSYIGGQVVKMQPFISDDAILKTQIMNAIVEAVDGMFLLARFHLDSLRDKVTRGEVKTALESLPTGSEAYEKMYANAMVRIQRQTEGHKGLAMRTLTWIVCTQKPLTTHELQGALAVKGNMKTLCKDDLPDLALVISVCSSMVTVDKKSNIIRLVHFTAQEYFLRNWEHWFPNAHSEVASMCLTYLTINRSQPKDSSALCDYAARFWGYHAQTQPSNDLAVFNFLRDSSKASAIAEYHAVRCICMDPCLAGPNNVTGLHLATYHGLEQMAKLLIESGVQLNHGDKDGLTPLPWAAERNNVRMAQLLLEYGANPNHIDVYHRTPLTWAAGHGNKSIIEVLLKKGADMEVKDYNNLTPLEWASDNCHYHVVILLLQHGARTGDTVESQTASAIIDDALKTGQNHLIDSNVENETIDRRPWLLAAARDGHVSIVERLLQKGVDPDYRDEPWGRSPISQAAEYGHPAVIELLVKNGVDPNMKDVNGYADSQRSAGQTPLMWAARCDATDACRVLLENGADPCLSSDYGHTALWWATSRDPGPAKLILEYGADPNEFDMNGRHPLSLSAEWNKNPVVCHLLDHPEIDVNLQERNTGRTALWRAAAKGHTAVVESLVKKGANVHIQDNDGLSALKMAADRGHQCVVDILQPYSDHAR